MRYNSGSEAPRMTIQGIYIELQRAGICPRKVFRRPPKRSGFKKSTPDIQVRGALVIPLCAEKIRKVLPIESP